MNEPQKLTRRQKAKKALSSTIIVSLFAIVILSFGINPFSSAPNLDAVTINDTVKITDEDYGRRVELLNESYKQQLGDIFNKFAIHLDIEKKALDGLIDTKLAELFTKELDFGAGPEQIKNQLSAIMRGSSLDKQTVSDFVKQTGYTREGFANQIKAEITASQLTTAIKTLVVPTEAEYKQAYRIANIKKGFDYIEIPASSFVDQVKVDDEEALKAHYESTKEMYRKPRSMQFSFVTFDPKEFYASVDIADEDVTTFYKEYIEEFKEPKQYHLRKIVIKEDEEKPEPAKEEEVDGENEGDEKDEAKVAEQQDAADQSKASDSSQTTPPATPLATPPAKKVNKKKIAQAVHDRLEGGEDFIKLAQEVNEDEDLKAKSGDLGMFTAKSLPTNLRKLVPKLEEGGYSRVLRTPMGFEIVYLEKITPERIKSIEEVAGEIVQRIREDVAPVYSEANAQEFFDKFISAETPLAEFAKTNNRPVVSLDQYISSQELAAGVPPDLANKVLNYNLGDKEHVTIGNLHYIVEVTNTKDSYFPDFAEVKDKVVKDYQEKVSLELARLRAQTLVEKLTKAPTNNPQAENPPTENNNTAGNTQPIATLAQLAQAENLEVKKATPNTEKDSDLPALASHENRRRAFTLTLDNKILPQVMEANRNFYLVELTSEDKSVDVEDREKFIAGAKQDAEHISARTENALKQKLRRDNKIDINPDILAKIAAAKEMAAKKSPKTQTPWMQ